MKKRGVRGRWFTEAHVKDFKSSALKSNHNHNHKRFELGAPRLQNAIYFSIFTISKKSHFTIFTIQNFVQNTRKHVNSIYTVGIMFVR